MSTSRVDEVFGILSGLRGVPVFKSNNPYIPSDLGRPTYEVIPEKFAGEFVRFIFVPHPQDMDLTATMSAAIGIIYDKARDVPGKPGVKYIMKCDYGSIIDAIEAKCLDLVEWSPSTRSDYLHKYMNLGLIRVDGDTYEIPMFRRWVKLPFVILAHPHLKITAKVIWAVLANMCATRYGIFPDRYELAMALGRTKKPGVKMVPKRFTSDHIKVFKSHGMVGERPRRNFMKKLDEIGMYNSTLLTGSLRDVRDQWCNPGKDDTKTPIVERRDAILRTFSPQYIKLTKKIQQIHVSSTPSSNDDRMRFVIQRHRLLSEIFAAIETLLPCVVTANDWVSLGIDSRSDIALFDVRPCPINYSKTYKDFPGAIHLSAQVDHAAIQARKGMESVLATSWA